MVEATHASAISTPSLPQPAAVDLEKLAADLEELATRHPDLGTLHGVSLANLQVQVGIFHQLAALVAYQTKGAAGFELRLAELDKRQSATEEKLADSDKRLSEIKIHVDDVTTNQKSVDANFESRFVEVDKRQSASEEKLADSDKRLSAIHSDVSALSASQIGLDESLKAFHDKMHRRLQSMEEEIRLNRDRTDAVIAETEINSEETREGQAILEAEVDELAADLEKPPAHEGRRPAPASRARRGRRKTTGD